MYEKFFKTLLECLIALGACNVKEILNSQLSWIKDNRYNLANALITYDIEKEKVLLHVESESPTTEGQFNLLEKYIATPEKMWENWEGYLYFLLITAGYEEHQINSCVSEIRQHALGNVVTVSIYLSLLEAYDDIYISVFAGYSNLHEELEFQIVPDIYA